MLRTAAVTGDAEVARVLLDNGADANVKDRDGKTPLMVSQAAWDTLVSKDQGQGMETCES